MPGGTMGGAVRRGGTVLRPAGPWTPTVHRLLDHLRSHGLTWVPQPVGVDDEGRDVLTHLPGDVPQYPLPAWVWDDAVLIVAGRLLGSLHRATSGLQLEGALWRLPAHEPVEVVCHNDFAPYNFVFDNGRLTGVIDWDTASPGPRVWDLAYLAYRLVPLAAPDHHDALASGITERRRRLALLCDAYGGELEPASVLAMVAPRLHELADLTAARATEAPHLLGHVALYRKDAAWVAAAAADLLT
ncbi:MAG: aminoglycoside phosphotransferase family protein [Actinomycetota bacterium]|nr:aminoglycoside phosphotransferase family protein [Actinomycetota bacterium]